MRRHSRAGGKSPNAQAPKAVARKSRIAPKAGHPGRTSTANLETEVARLTRERDEALEQQAAISDILQVISNSPADVQPVLDSVAEHAARICEAHVVDIAIVDDEVFRIAASFGKLGRLSKGEAAPLDRSSVTGRSIYDLQPVHIADMENAGDEFPLGREFATRFKHRTILSVPLIREGYALGAILVRRTEVRPFEEKHIALLKAFANQAAIAIENVRLFKAEQQRTRELSESLEQQTATSEVLQVISRSPGDVDPVFATMLEKAVRISDAKFGGIYRWDGNAFSLVATHNVPPAYAEARRFSPFRPGPKHPWSRMVATKAAIHIADAATDLDYIERRPEMVAAVELGSVRTFLVVPMLKENELIGAFYVARQEVRSFTDKQIELIQNFAAQAVIAIENTRLLNELRQRTTDLTERTTALTESLERQTATSEVLQVISSSPGDLQSVFAAMLENAVRICDTKFGNIYRWDGELMHLLAAHNTPPALAEVRRQSAFRPTSFAQRIVETRTAVQVLDLAADESYTDKDPPSVTAVELGGVRTVLSVPLVKKNELIGSFSLYRQEVRPFTAKQIEFVENFSKQAVIAIENARLLNELRESLQQQTATADVLKVISRSTFDLQTVLDALTKSAAQLCEADKGLVFQRERDVLRLVANYGFSGEAEQYWLEHPLPVDGGNATGRAVLEGRAIHIPDVLADTEYRATRYRELAGYRTVLSVPLLRDGTTIGTFSLTRDEVNPFTDKHIELVTTFADQAVIAIENARLLNELRQRTNDLTETLEQQTGTSEILRVISSSPTDVKPVLDAIVRTAVGLCNSYDAVILLKHGEHLRIAAHYGPMKVDFEQLPIGRDFVSGRTVIDGSPVHVHDLTAEGDEFPRAQEIALRLNQRTVLGLPLSRDDQTIGCLFLRRTEVLPFTDQQIALLQTFADQAVIAIENTRLFEAEQQRTRELTESLEQQTATSKVLDVISRSAFDLHAVFETVAESSVRLCGADRAFIYRFDGELLRLAVSYNTPKELREFVERNPLRPGRHSCAARAALERRTIHIPDVSVDPEYTFGAKAFENVSTILGVPILKGNDLLGVMNLHHNMIRPFTDTQIALVETFADQAAIAIENVRLLDELRQRTTELSRSVEELRALGEVSQAVNSTLDLETVLSTIVAKAVQLCGTEAGAIYVFDELQREFHLRATYGMDQELIEALTQRRIGLDDPNIAQALAQPEPIQIADLREEASNEINEITLRAGYLARLVAPLRRGEDVVGFLVVRRCAPGAFPQNTVDLIKTFAAQSAVAIENARLFKNVEASLEDLRTTQDRLVQTQKLASLGQLTAGIAHEIKNPLNFVNNFSGVSAELMDELREAVDRMTGDDKTRAEITELADTLRDNLDKIVQHGKRADSIVKNMLLHSREGSGEHRPIDMNALIEEAVNLAYHGARAEKQGFNITLERSFDPAAGQVDCFPQEITRALLNLISNGFYAATKRKEQDNSEGYEPTLIATTKNLGDRLEIRIRDNGTGIPPEVKEKIFNPFFTTKPAGEGTGLGLSITHDIIVKQHSGSIEVDSRPGEYTEVRIVLPRAAAFPH
jgi:GAF domain-containing protein